jgi:hypothetical protein
MMNPRPIMRIIHPANDIGRIRFNNEKDYLMGDDYLMYFFLDLYEKEAI